MQPFAYFNGQLCAEGVPLGEIAARYGTPCYVYSRAEIENQWHAYDQTLADVDHLICYAVKANSTLAILDLLTRLDSGFDIVSVGELERVVKAGGDPCKVVFSGVGKRDTEMQRALELGIKCFNIESVAELERLNQVAGKMKKKAPISLRVNPDVDAETHPYIATGLKESKFGIAFEKAFSVYEQAAAMENITICGIDCHIGSQITTINPFIDALQRVMWLVKELQSSGIHMKHIDLGGGLGIRYQEETPPSPREYAEALSSVIGNAYELIIEPGRSIAGNAGVLLTQVEYLNFNTHRNFAVVNAAMNDLLRPALYNVWHDILPVKKDSVAPELLYEIVGPVCETGDFLGKQRMLALQQGDLLAVCSAGAYGFSMSSTYNSRPRVPEIMVDGEKVYEIRQRETIEGLMAGETVLPG
jgi:diaminopimelate decarboxylase